MPDDRTELRGALLAVTLLWLWSGPVAAQSSPEAAHGAPDFARFCAACHGADGRGAGPRASRLARKPADLTRLTARNAGRFPRITTYNVIKNGGGIRAHRVPGTPSWGKLFAAEPSPLPPETAADTRILDLLDFLKSIQRQ